jgi:hypothetical protein
MAGIDYRVARSEAERQRDLPLLAVRRAELTKRSGYGPVAGAGAVRPPTCDTNDAPPVITDNHGRRRLS